MPVDYCDIYREKLGITYPNLGYALWKPTFVDVGDVGFIRDGEFLRLFNVLYSKDHRSNLQFGVPDNHEPLYPTGSVPNYLQTHRGDTLQRGNYCSTGVNMAPAPESLSQRYCSYGTG